MGTIDWIIGEKMKSQNHSVSDREIAAKVLGDLLRENGGEISWEQFVEAALYHPVVGYYASRIQDVGAGGDFATSTSLGEVLGQAITAYGRATEKEILAPLRLVEMGAGNGKLMSQVLRGLPLRSRLRRSPAIIESSLPLMRKQKRLLRFRGVTWVQRPSQLELQPGQRVLGFANEFIDAFPPLVVVMRAGQWREVALAVKQGRLVEIERDPSPRCRLAVETMHFGPAREGLRREILLSFRDWMSEVARCNWRGRLLFVDYGSSVEELYCRAPQGTLRAYYKHQRLTGRAVVERFGRQDITTDVNFTDVRLWALELGWSVVSERTQAEFLAHHGVLQKDPVGRRLADPEAAGGAFRVLECAL